MPSDLNIKKDGDVKPESSTPPEAAPSSDLASVVDDLLNQLTTKFSTISTELIGKMDDMSRRLDTLEATIQANTSVAEKDESN